MAKFPTHTKIELPESNTSHNDKSHIKLTTSNWLQPGVIFFREVPKQYVDRVNVELFSRLQPMVLPTFGNARFENKFFFVPFSRIWKPYNDFKEGTPFAFSGGVAIPSIVPVFDNEKIITLLETNSLRMDNNVGGSQVKPTAGTYDFCAYAYIPGSSTQTNNTGYYRMSSKGRFIYKIINQLGYKINFTQGKQNQSALPLMALAKVWYDYYENSNYINDTSLLTNIRLLLESITNNLTLTQTDINNIFDMILHVYYDNDFVVSTFDNPMGPNVIGSTISISDYLINGNDTTNTTELNTDSKGTPRLNAPSANDVRKPSQYILNVLKRTSDMVERYRIAGGRSVERILADYGVRLDDVQANRCSKIAEFNVKVNFGDIMSTSDTSGATLGAYAGKGIAYDNNYIDINTGKEWGYIIGIQVIKPSTSYFQGYKRHTQHLTRFDFFDKNYDGVGCSAVAAGEVCTPVTDKSWSDRLSTGDLTQTIYGYLPRYYEYKIAQDELDGDFICSSQNQGLDAWHLFRTFETDKFITNAPGGVIPPAGTLNFRIVHNRAITQTGDHNQYNRIFSAHNTVYDNVDPDNFYIFMQFNEDEIFPGRSLFDDYDWDNEAKKITVPVGGIHE